MLFHIGNNDIIIQFGTTLVYFIGLFLALYIIIEYICTKSIFYWTYESFRSNKESKENACYLTTRSCRDGWNWTRNH